MPVLWPLRHSIILLSFPLLRPDVNSALLILDGLWFVGNILCHHLVSSRTDHYLVPLKSARVIIASQLSTTFGRRWSCKRNLEYNLFPAITGIPIPMYSDEKSRSSTAILMSDRCGHGRRPGYRREMPDWVVHDVRFDPALGYTKVGSGGRGLRFLVVSRRTLFPIGTILGYLFFPVP